MRSGIPGEAAPRFEARILPGPDALAEAAAEEIRLGAREAIESRGVFRIALSGGSTPRRLHARLTERPYRGGIRWSRIRFFFGDERCVPPGSDRSNYGMAKETLFDRLRVPPEHVFRMRGEDDPKAAAAAYARVLADEVETERGAPRFDMVLLGLGPDGHTASLFPGTRALGERERTVAANWVPRVREWRITMTYRVLNASRRVVFIVAGADKAAPATAILRRERGYRDLPAAAVRPKYGSLLWLLDEEAGARL